MKKIMTIICCLSICSTAFADTKSAYQATMKQAKSIIDAIPNSSDNKICYSLGVLGQKLENLDRAAMEQSLDDKSGESNKIVEATTDLLNERFNLKKFCQASNEVGDREILIERLKSLMQILVEFNNVYISK